MRPNDINFCSSGVLKIDLAEKFKQVPALQQSVIKCWVLKQLYECGLFRAAFNWGRDELQEMPLGYDLPFSLLNHSVALILSVHHSNLVAAVLIWCDFIGTVLQTVTNSSESRRISSKDLQFLK